MKTALVSMAVLVLTCTAFGCTRAHTVVKVKDASDVSLAFRRIGSATVEPIPAGHTDMNLRLSAIDVDEDGFLQREAGAIRIACARCEDKTLTLLDPERMSASAALDVQTIVSARRVELPFEYQVSANEEVYPLLRTPTGNVEYFEQTTEPVSELGWLLVPGGLLTVVGLIVIPQDTLTGLAMLVPGLALDAIGGVHLVLPSDTRRFNAEGQPIAARAPRRTASSTRRRAVAADQETGGEEGAEAADSEGQTAEPSEDE